ncbi:hypothetical protein ACFY2W_15895 [Streptomyces sp. NPDC001262]|uniref:hypothetical protein n=1 Tax=Streptomyces TaxID=1883 RepID=UPI00368A64D3
MTEGPARTPDPAPAGAADRTREEGAGRTDPSRPLPTLPTEFPFTLPRGYVDDEGRVHRDGVMRLATARDELFPLRDQRVQDNPPYLSVVLLARVVTRLGTLTDIHASMIEDLFAADLAFLQRFYEQINTDGTAIARTACPQCHHEFPVDMGSRLGE